MGNTYLITWNPNKWDFEGGFSSFLQSVSNGEKYVEPWTVCNSNIHKGDALYLMKLGSEPRGIIAKGFHWMMFILKSIGILILLKQAFLPNMLVFSLLR